MKNEESVQIAVAMWEHFNNMEWDKARGLFADNFEAYWVQSNEVIKGADNFIRIKCDHPDTHNMNW